MTPAETASHIFAVIYLGFATFHSASVTHFYLNGTLNDGVKIEEGVGMPGPRIFLAGAGALFLVFTLPFAAYHVVHPGANDETAGTIFCAITFVSPFVGSIPQIFIHKITKENTYSKTAPTIQHLAPASRSVTPRPSPGTALVSAGARLPAHAVPRRERACPQARRRRRGLGTPLLSVLAILFSTIVTILLAAFLI